MQATARDQRLVQVYAGVGQREPAPLVARHQDHSSKARRAADRHRRDGRLDELHGVVDREPGRDGAARRVDVDLDLLVGIVGGQEDQLGHSQVGHHVVDRAPEQDDPVPQEPGVDVEGALAVPAFVLDHGGDVGHVGRDATYICR